MRVIGKINLKGDKSISHRALILASICKGESSILNLPYSQDIQSTINCLRKTGIDIINKRGITYVKGGQFIPPKENLHCNNSGTTMRLLAGLYSSRKIPVRLIGDKSLSNRPMKRIIEPLLEMGIKIESKNFNAPLILSKFNPRPIDYSIPIASAQVKSSLILASMSMNEKCIIRQKTATRDHLELMIDSISKNAIRYTKNQVVINPNADKLLDPFKLVIPGDISSASYFIALAVLLKGSKLEIENLLLNPHRTGFIETLISMGADIEILDIDKNNNEKVGKVIVKGGPTLNPCTILNEDIPKMIDEIPILALVCSYINGVSKIKGLKELRYKESDRLSGIYHILKAMGVEVSLDDGDSMEIKGSINLYNTNKLDNCNDHRLALMISCLQILSSSKINFDNCINVSFPDFKDLIKKILVA